MQENEISDAYRARFQSSTDRRERETQVLTDGTKTISRSSVLAWVFVATTVENPVRQGLDQDFVKETREWILLKTPQISLLNREYIGNHTRAMPAPGRVSFFEPPHTEDKDPASSRYSHFDLYASGDCFGAIEMPDSAHGRISQGQLTDAVIYSLLVALEWSIKQGGGWGDLNVHVGIVLRSHYGEDLGSSPLELMDRQHDTAERSKGTRLVYDAPYSITTVSAPHLGDTESKLKVIADALSGLLAWFGLATSRFITNEGAIVQSAWSPTDVSRWLQQLP
jgi:hypothetical protein